MLPGIRGAFLFSEESPVPSRSDIRFLFLTNTISNYSPFTEGPFHFKPDDIMTKRYTIFSGLSAMVIATLVLLVASTHGDVNTAVTHAAISDSSLAISPTAATIAGIQQEIANREYHITFDSVRNALQSPNRRHNLRAYYRPGRLSIQNRIDSAGQNFSMEIVSEGIYADGMLIAKAKPEATAENQNDTLRIAHGDFLEEFINNPSGVRQNFIVNKAPARAQQLSVRLSAHGLRVRREDAGQIVFYSNDNGKQTDRLTYDDLKCWDANGKLLAAGLVLSGNEIEINVDVKNAAYPVTIDPLITNGNPANADKTLEINQSYAWAGFSVASAGDVNGDGYSDVLVGAPNYDNGQSDEGAALLYPGTASGISLAATVLECNQANAQMGYSVSSAGDINKDGFSDILVGVPFYDASGSNEGAVMIYKGSANGLVTNNPYIFKLDQAESNLGVSVAMAGDVNGDGYSDILAGAHQFDHDQSNEGVGVLVYGAPNGLGMVTFLECNQPDAMMGFAVAGAGDVDGDGFSDVMVGARLFDNGHANEGAAFIYKGSAGGPVTANPTIIEGNQLDARLGHALSSAGDINGDGFSDVALGAFLYDKGSSNEGAVMIHLGGPNGIGAVASQILESDQVEAQFGFSVACAGDVNADGYADLIVGARYYDKGQSNEGAAFIYQGSQGGLNPTPASTIESDQQDAWLGSAVASGGDVNGDGFSDVLVGSYAFDHGQKDEGSVFVWYGGGLNIRKYVVSHLEMNLPGNLFGWSVASAGDVNADGFGDVIVSAKNYDNGQPGEGAAFIFHGSIQGVSSEPNITIESNQQHANLGVVSSAGDVNGDGFVDIIIGMPLYDTGSANEGKACVLYGSPSGISTLNQTTLLGTQHEACLGAAVSCAGDLNKDGYSDIVVGESGYDIDDFEYSDEGRVWVYYGSADGIDPDGTNITGQINYPYFGSSVCGSDVDGDGYSDILIVSTFFEDGEFYEGAALIYHGSQNGLNTINPMILQSNVTGALMGDRIAVNDINGDGFVDIAVGGTGYSNPENAEGAIFIYYGSDKGPSTLPSIVESNVVNSYFGRVSTAGDVNGDGYGDLIIGSYGYSNGQENEGAFYLYLGSPNGLSNKFDILVQSNQNSAFLGGSVASAGDINGDGFSDIITSANQYDNNQVNEGRVSIYYGNGALGTRNNLRLYNSSDLSTPINHTQFPQNNFGAGLFAKSFTGRNKGKLVWETKPVAQAFSKGSNNRITNSTQSTNSQNAYTSLGTTGVELKNIIDKQGPSTKVRVRVKYDPVLALTGQTYGPWRYLPAYLMGNSTAPTPEQAAGDASEVRSGESVVVESGTTGELPTIYPNPVSERLHIHVNDAGQVRNIQILAQDGAIKYQASGFKAVVDVHQFSSGIYYLVITQTDGSRTTRRILISR